MQLRARTRARERENTQKATHDILWAERVIFSCTRTHTNTDAKYSAFLLEIERETPIRPRENIPNLRERVPLSFFFPNTSSFRRIFCTKNWISAKHITVANSKYHTCYSFVNYLCKSKNYKKQKHLKRYTTYTVLSRERESESVRARARERESSETWVIS